MRLGLASRQTASTCAENNSKTFIIVTPNNTIEKEKPHLTTFQTTSGFIEIYTFFFQLYVYFTFFSLIIIIVLVQIFPLPPFRLQGMVCLFIFLINCIVKYMQSQGSHWLHLRVLPSVFIGWFICRPYEMLSQTFVSFL